MSKTLIKEIKTALENNTAILGLKRTLKNKDTKKIIIASNCPEDMIKRLKSKEKVTIETFDGTNAELGELCKKPFTVSVLSIKSK